MTRTGRAPIVTAIVAMMGLVSSGVGAQGFEVARKISEHNDWTAWKADAAEGPVCFATSEPTAQEGDYTRRGEVIARITHRPGRAPAGSWDVFSMKAGYTYAADSRVTLEIDGETFTLFANNDTAWSFDQDDRRLVQAIRAGNRMVVRGQSSRGTDTVDTFSLRGSTAAVNAINEACGRR